MSFRVGERGRSVDEVVVSTVNTPLLLPMIAESGTAFSSSTIMIQMKTPHLQRSRFQSVSQLQPDPVSQLWLNVPWKQACAALVALYAKL